ncbi:MAG: leukotoxin LktA family filamentous adhesin [Azonexus sp.]
MNHVYRLIWNANILRWVVAPETAKGHGKNSSTVRSGRHAAGYDGQSPASFSLGQLLPDGKWCRRSLLCALLALQPSLILAQSITPDGRTQTTVSINGMVTNITTATIRGANGFNSFQTFGVGAGTTANLFLPSGTQNLINLVRDQQTNIAGILNAIKDGRIGGNVYFANPNGFLVSANGVVNVGSLSVSAPTPAFVNNFFDASGAPNDSYVASLLKGTAPRNAEALIAILGQVNAADGISLSAGTINVGGTLYSGARFIGAMPDFSDVVNANGLASASNVVIREGQIEIVADHDVNISGSLSASGGTDVRGGNIGITAGGNIDLQNGAQLLAKGLGVNSDGGAVYVWAGNNATTHGGALIDASAGSSGNGGNIEFSAAKQVDLAGGSFLAGATNGQRGTVLIDPATINVSSNFYAGGADYSLLADQSITINSGVTVSTRQVAGGAGADQDTASSVGDSGNLSLSAQNITLQSGSRLLAQSTDGYRAGDITLNATSTGSQLDVLSNTAAQISLSGATVKGGDVSFAATASHASSVSPVVTKTVSALIDVDSSQIVAQGRLDMNASATTNSATGALPIPAALHTITSTAKVDVHGASRLTTTSGDASLNAVSAVTTEAKPTSALAKLAGDGEVAISVINSTASVHLGDTSQANIGSKLGLTAENTVSTTSLADASAAGSAAAGAAVAVSVINSKTTAYVDGQATLSVGDKLDLSAKSKNTAIVTAKAAAKGAQKDSSGTSESAKTLEKYKDTAKTSEGSASVAGAIAVSDLTNDTRAYIASSGLIDIGGALALSSQVANKATVLADGSATSGSVGVGAAVGVNIGVSTNVAQIGDNTDVHAQGVSLSAVNIDGLKSEFSSEARSGAGAGNVGVAGALAANVVVNTTVAGIEGDTDSSGTGASVNAGSGDVLIEAGNTTSSTLKSGATVTGTGTSAKVGVGATAGINVAINTTVAEIADQAVLSGGKDLQLNATAAHTTSSEATGGAAGAQVAVTPVVAVALAVNTTSARLGEAGTALGLSGAYSSKAEQSSTTTSKATGQTQGDKVAVGASIALTIATDTVTADVERNITAADGVGVAAKSTARSSSTATASAKGGAKAKSDGSAGSTDASTPDAPGKSVDEQVAAQGDAAKASGQKTAAAAPKPAATGSDAGSKLADTKSAPKTDETTQAGGVSVAAAVGINTGVATTTAKVGKGRRITSSNGALQVSSTNETDASAKADGSQVDSGNTDVGIGAAVALNVGVSTNVAQISDNALINTRGVTVSAVNSAGQKSDYAAEATSGAGAGNVGVAGSLAANVVVNTTVALLEGDTDSSGTGASVNAGSGDVLVEAANATNSTVKTGANVTGTDAAAKVGIGASIGMDIAINTTVAEVADQAVLSGGKDLQLNATAAHTTSSEATGGASGAQVAVTPVVAVALAVNTTSARLGESTTGLGLSGAYSSKAEQSSTTTSKASGQTQGDKVAVGASISLTIATDTVTADVERNITAADGVSVAAKSTAKSSSTATASATGGAKAKSDGSAGSTDTSTPDAPGKSVDEQVTTQGDAAKAAGQKNADTAPKTSATGGDAGSKLNDKPQPTPKAETSEGGVTVAAAAGINIGVATTTAKVGKGRRITSSSGALQVSSSNETDTSAKADGSQVDGGNTKVGVGAAVALNVGVSTNQAVLGDNAVVRTHGLTVSAVNIADQKSDGSADAKSGAGASNVGVAGALALNTTTNTTLATVEGDKDSSGSGADIDADGGDVLVEARNATTNMAKTAADVKMSGSNAKVGVGASIGVNVVVNTTAAEVGDQARLVHAGNLALNAAAAHTMSTEVTGGAAGAKVSITPVVAAAVAVNTTTARLGTSSSETLDLSGTYSSTAEQTNSMTTKATGQAQGDVAVGASLAASIGIDHVAATIERDVESTGQLDLKASSATSIVTEAKAGAKGAKAAAKNDKGEETPEAGSTVDEQKKNQLDFAKGRNSGAAAADTTTPDAKTPATTEQTPGTDKPTTPPSKDQQGKKVSVAAAIGVSVSNNEAYAGIGAGRTINTGSGDINIHAGTDTNYRTQATGEAVSDDIGIAAAVALTATRNNTQARLGAGTTISQAGDINITATSTQNRADAFLRTMSAEAVSGASGGDVAVAGSLAVVLNENETTATIDEGASIGSAVNVVGDVAVKAEDTSKISAQARAGALSKGDNSKAGVGASFAVLLSYNHNTAAVGYDTPASYAGTTLYANSLTVEASKNRVWFNVPSLADAKNFVVNDVKNLNFDALDPSSYLGSNNYYTEAVAGAAAKGNAAVAGAFAVNIFGNTTEAHLGQNVHATLSGSQPEAVPGTPNAEKLGADISARSDTQAIAFSGAVAGAKKAGVGISNTDIVSLDETLASIASGSTVIAEATGAGVKVDASSRQDIANVSVSAGVGTESTGVGGVLGVIVSLNKSDASIDDGATVKAQGDVAVQASSDSNTVMVSGGVGGGKEVGVGAAIAANILANETHASIGQNAEVDALQTVSVKADADETAVTAVVAGAGGGKAGVAAALSINAVFSDTAAFVGEGAKINTDAAYANAAKVAIQASDDTVIVGIAGGGAGGGDVGVGASLDTTVLAKAVKAYVADDTTADGQVATLKADQEIAIDAASSENIVSVSAGFAGGGKVGVGGAVSVGVVINDVQAYVGKSASVDSDGNVLVNAQDDTTAVLTAGSAAGGGQAGVGGSLAVATLLGSTKAYIADDASVNARGLGNAATVYSGETVFSDTENKPTAFLAKQTESAKGLSVTAYDRENLITTVASGAGGGTAGVAATVSANVIARTTEASVGQGVKINESNTTAGADQQVRMKAIDETLLIDTAAGAGGGGTAGVGAAANVGVIAKTTTAKIGKNSLINAKKAVELSAASSDVTVGVTAGFAGGGSAGVGGAVAAVGVANTTQAYIEDATSAAEATKVNVSAGDLNVDAKEFSSSWLVTGAGAGGGAAGVGGSLAVGVNSSTTFAKIGDYAETNATDTTSVHADSTENVNTITVAGAGGGAAGVAGSISVNVIISKTEAGIGKHARVNQDLAGSNVDVKASDRIISVAAAGAGAGGGAAGVGGTAAVTVALNTTSAYIDNDAAVSADQDVKVDAKSEKYVNSATVAGAGGGAAGVAGAVAVLSVGSLLDGEAKSGLSGQDENGNTTTMQGQADSQTTKSSVGSMLGDSDQSKKTTAELDSKASKLAVAQNMSDSAPIPLKNTQAFIGKNTVVKAGNNVAVSASDTTLAILASGAGAGGGAAGVAGSLGVVLLHDSAEAFIADGAAVDAGKKVSVAAETGENVYNVGVTGSGAGAAAVDGAVVVNVVTSNTAAYIGDADINQGSLVSSEQSLAVTADSSSNLLTVAGSGGGAGAASVGGVLNVNTLIKDTRAYIGEGAHVAADQDVQVAAASAQNVIGGGVSIRGAGAAAVSGVISANVVDNTTEAFIGAADSDATKTAAVVDSDGNVRLAATDDTLLLGISAIGNGAGAAAVGISIGANVISSHTRAYVAENSTVNARGNAAASNVYSGAISSTPGALPDVPGGGSGDIDANHDGTKDGSVKGGLSFNVKAESNGSGEGGADSTANPAAAKSSDGSGIAAASGGLGAKTQESQKGLSVVAMGNEKVITTNIGVAGAGAAAVTGAATVNVISSTTEARIDDGTTINSIAGGLDPSVRVRAADNTFMVQTAGTVAGAGAAAVSGSNNTAVVNKTTTARIGKSTVKAKNVEISAAAKEDIYNITANLSIGGIAGVGAAVGVNVVDNTTTASIGAGANIDATGDLRVTATQDTGLDLYTIAGAGGLVGVSGALSVGVVTNTTSAHVDGAADPAQAATLNAGGTTAITAEASEDISSVTASAAGGGVGVAGAVGVKVVKTETTAYIGDNTKVNQTRSGAAQDVTVSATDDVLLSGGGGAASAGLYAAGASAEVNIVRNTTTAYLGDDTLVKAGRDVAVSASASKEVQSVAAAAAGGYSAAIGGAVSVVTIGAKLDSDSQGSLRGSSGGESGDTASFADGKVKQDKVSGALGNSEHVQGMKGDVSGQVAGLGVAADMNETSVSSLDKTQAYVGNRSQIIAGGKVDVTASDKTQLTINAVGAAGGFVGIGGALGIGITNSTTEAFVGSSAQIEADGNVNVEANAGNVNTSGSTVRAVAGAGGIVGLSAAVSVLDDSSTSRAYIGSDSQVRKAQTLSVKANTRRKATADTIGASVGALAVGASVARSEFTGHTSAYLENGVLVGKTSGKTVDDVLVAASDESIAAAHATAGTAGILAGSGADAKATVGSRIEASLGNDVAIVAQDTVTISASATPQSEASALGINIGAGAVGASLATAKSDATVITSLGTNDEISANTLDVLASHELGSAPSALAHATGASGGLLLGVNATVAKAESTGQTSALIGNGSTLNVTGTSTVKADNKTQQTSSGIGFSIGGFIAVGADFSQANSSTLTEAVLGNDIKVTGNKLQVLASSDDSNYAYALAGSGGMVSVPYSLASTSNTSHTYARTGGGNNTSGDARKIDVSTFLISAHHTARFDSWLDSSNASLIGVSGAKASNSVDATTEAHIGTSGYIEADNITMQAYNDIIKSAPATGVIPGLGRLAPIWNVKSTSGGLADVPAAESTTVITDSALTQVGAGAHLEQTGDRNAPGAFRLDAWNNIAASDRVEMTSGGAVSAASAKSGILADTNNATVRVGELSELSSVGDMLLGARSIANISTQAAVDVYGLVGVAPRGDSVSRFLAANSIDIGTGATLSSLHDIKLAAGANSAGTINDITATARTDVYNNTAIPVNRDPVADAIIDTQSLIKVGAATDIGAVRNVMLYAENGSATASGIGIGKDIYRETLAAIASAISEAFGGDEVSFETRTGRSLRNQTTDVEINGNVHTGTERQQKLVIGPDGKVTSATAGISIGTPGFKDVAGDIQDRIAYLDKLIGQYAVGDANADSAIAVAAYRSEISFLQRKLKDMGFTTGEVAKSSLSALQAAQQSVAGMTTTRTAYATTVQTKTDENTGWSNQNNTLGAQNVTLQTVTIPDLTAQRAALDKDAADYLIRYNNLTTQITNAGNTVTGNTATISSNTDKINANLGQITTLNSDIARLDSQISGIQTAIANNSYSSTPASGPLADFLTVKDVSAQLGNIYVRGNRLHGAGTLDSPGDAQITITNNGPTFLILNNLTISPDLGGKVYFNSVDVKSNTDINRVNGTNGGAGFNVFTADSKVDSSGHAVTASKPVILVESKYDPLDNFYLQQTAAINASRGAGERKIAPLAPDIILQGDVSNLRGLVKIDSAAGSIRLEQKPGSITVPPETASVRADEVQIKTRNGDFVQSYSNSYFNTGGDPLTVIPGDPELTPDTNSGRFDRITYTPETAGSGIVANGSVMIAARYLNINGIIQSGISEWGVKVPADATVTVNGTNMSFAAARAYYNSLSEPDVGTEYFTVSGATVAGLPAATQGSWEQITVRYNAKENRLELSGVQVQGGYIELFGQIYNTNTHGGELRVLDGYGQIKVDNLSTLPLWVNTLDTGRGVKGEINITDIIGIDGNGVPIITTQNYTRTPGAGRDDNYSYNPATGLRYAMSVGKDSGKIDNYRYSSGAFFGIEALPAQLDQYWISGRTTKNDPIANNGEFLGLLPSADDPRYKDPTFSNYSVVTQSKTTASKPVQTASWFECNWATLCIYGTYYKEFNISSTTKEVTTASLKADNKIAIKYIGFDNGGIDVNSTGNVVINGALNNRNGDTKITSSGSITQNGDTATVSGNNLLLDAGTGIGSTTQALQVNIKDGGKLDATSDSGDVRVSQILGDLRVGSIGGAGVSNVYLEADRNLIGWDNNAYVQGKRVELLSRNGGIGTLSDTENDPFRVVTGYTINEDELPNNGLKATARESINIRNDADPLHADTYSGNLLLISAESAAGDVRIETSGSIIDNNPYATTDSRTQEELANLWDDMRLRGTRAADKADEAVLAYRNGKSNNYQLYWQMRRSQANGGNTYDPQYTLTTAEKTALANAGMSSAEITQFEANRRNQYQQLNTEVGGLTSSYVSGYSYTLSADEEASIRKGSSWTDSQLALSVGAGLLKNITDTVTTIKEPNAKGHSVTLIAGQNIGSYDDAQHIDLKNGLDGLSVEQKAALAAAERGDAQYDAVNRIITISQPRPVNVAVGNGALNATATAGYALIGSEQDLRIDQVKATGEIRIKTAGSLIDAGSVNGQANIEGGNLILEAANGGIGSLPDAEGAVSLPLRLDLASGASVISRAADDIWIVSADDLSVDTAFSRKDIRLEAEGSILDAHTGESTLTPDNNLRARNLWLTARSGSIGAPDNALDAGVNADGQIHATASTIGQGIYLNGPFGEYFNIAYALSGDALELSSATSMKITGTVSAPGPISLVSGGQMNMTSQADIHATTLGVFVSSGAGLTMEDAADGSNAARIRVDHGTINIETVGDALITGIETGNTTGNAVRIVSKEGRILDNGDTRLDIIADSGPDARLTIAAAKGIGDNQLDTRLSKLEATSGGIVDIDVQNGVDIVGITAGDRIWLTAGGDITGGRVSSSGTGGTNPDKSVSIASSSGGVNLAGVSGLEDVTVTAPDDIYVGQGQAGAGFTARSSGGDLTFKHLSVGSSVFLYGDRITADITGTSGWVGGAIGGGSGGYASNIDLNLSAPGGFRFSDISTNYGNINSLLGELWVDNLLVGHRLLITNPLTNLLVDQDHRTMQPADVQLYSDGAGFRLGLWDNHVFSSAQAIWHEPTHDVINADGTSGTAVEKANQVMNELRRLSPENENSLIVSTGDNVSISGAPPAVALNNPETADCDDILHCEK